jgi:signal peptidase II
MLAGLASRRVLRHALPAALAAAVAIVAFDQLSKYLVVEQMNLRETGEIHVFPGLNFRMAWNTGVNFGLLAGGGDAARYILAAGTSLVALALLFGSVFSRRTSTAIGFGIAAGGAVGNTIDRLNWGAVADFLNVSCCGIRNPWSFNIADIAVFAGFALILIPLPRSGPRSQAPG